MERNTFFHTETAPFFYITKRIGTIRNHLLERKFYHNFFRWHSRILAKKQTINTWGDLFILIYDFLVFSKNIIIFVMESDEISTFAQKWDIKNTSVERYQYDPQMMFFCIISDIITVRVILFVLDGIRQKYHATLALKSQSSALPDMIGQKFRFIVQLDFPHSKRDAEQSEKGACIPECLAATLVKQQTHTSDNTIQN